MPALAKPLAKRGIEDRLEIGGFKPFKIQEKGNTEINKTLPTLNNNN